jgi:hypothetical protein
MCVLALSSYRHLGKWFNSPSPNAIIYEWEMSRNTPKKMCWDRHWCFEDGEPITLVDGDKWTPMKKEKSTFSLSPAWVAGLGVGLQAGEPLPILSAIPHHTHRDRGAGSVGAIAR